MTASIKIHEDGSVTISDEAVTRREFNYASMAALVSALDPVPDPDPDPDPDPEHVTPEQFGAVGDGLADDLNALNAAIDAAKGTGKDLACRKNAVYLVSGKPAGLIDWKNFVWHGNGATIKAAKGVPTTSGGSFITFTRCSGFDVIDLSVDGNSQERGNVENWSAHNFQLLGCEDFSFQDVKSINAPGDGWRLAAVTPADTGTFCKNGLFYGCVAEFSGRNGISFIEAWDMKVSGGEYRNSFFTNPAEGIDIEPNKGSASPGCKDILIEDALFEGNRGAGLQVSTVAGVRDVQIIGCTFRGNGGVNPKNGPSQSHGAAIYLGGQNVLVEECVFEDHLVGNERTLGLVFIPINPEIRNIRVVRNVSRNNPMVGSSKSFSQFHTRGRGQDRSIVFDGNEIDATGSAIRPIGMESDNGRIVGNRIVGWTGTGPAIRDAGLGNKVEDNVVDEGDKPSQSQKGK